MGQLGRYLIVMLGVLLLTAAVGCTDEIAGAENEGENDANDEHSDNDDNDANDNDEQNNGNDCEASTDSELCADADFVCGEATLSDECGEERTVDCGGCDGDEACEDNQCVCESSTDSQLCANAGYNCGEITLTDECGQERSVECGSCPLDDCEDNVCGCIPDNCKTLADSCGITSDGCGGQVLCNTDCAHPIAIGAYHACITKQGGGVECWGFNDEGQLGTVTPEDADGVMESSSTGVDVDGLSDEVLQVHAGEQHTCAQTLDGSVYCWGSNNYEQLTDLVSDDYAAEAVEMTNLAGPATALGTGGFHTCAEFSPGDMQCWGENWDGQLGTGDNGWYTTPQDVLFEGSTSAGIRKFDGGPWFSCYVDGDDDLYCWGENTFGQIGNEYPWDGEDGDLYEPHKVEVDVESPILDFSGGGTFIQGSGVGYTISGFTCAIDATGALKCWGYNGYGQLGTDTDPKNHSEFAQEISGLLSPQKVAAGGEHACALEQSGTVRCWGYNEYGQLGDGSTDDSMVPVEVVGLNGVAIDIFAGTFHTCALMEEGDFKCWGHNADGQLGDGTTTDRSTPVSVFQ